MAPPRRALIAITSAHVPLYNEGGETGLFITEALHPFQVFRAAGFEVDLASETGEYWPDWVSLTDKFITPAERAIYDDHNSEFRAKLDKLHKASELNAADYGIFFASAGHAALIDYPNATDLQAIATSIYAAGGIVSAVCHGPAIFKNIKAPDGSLLIKGRTVTGFTNKGEVELGIMGEIDAWNRPTIEATAADLGAHYISPAGPWDSFTQTDGRVVTGANPESAKATAEAVLKVFDTLK